MQKGQSINIPNPRCSDNDEDRTWVGEGSNDIRAVLRTVPKRA